MNSLPSVSAVVPVYNDADTLARAVASILAQSSPVTEIIVVDDASTDDPGGALAPFNAQPVPVRLLRHGVNRGASAARNTGIRAASGDLVALLDGDDAWHPDKIERQLDSLDRAGAAVWACVGGFALYRAGRSVPEIYRLAPFASLGQEMAWGCRLSPGSTLMVRRAAFETVGYYDEVLRRLEDWDWLIRLAQHSEIAVVEDPVADIYLSYARGPANTVPTFAAVDHIRARHHRYFASLGAVPLQRFRATLALERAAACVRAKRKVHAVLFMLAAVLAWPFQRRAFFNQLLRGFSPFLRPPAGA